MGLHLGPGHVLAGIAAGHCVAHREPLVGGVACGRCWELAIRDDERLVVETQLPRLLTADPELIDQVAVQRAVTGPPQKLTRAERRTAIQQLDEAGTAVPEIARKLRMSGSSVRRELERLTASCAA